MGCQGVRGHPPWPQPHPQPALTCSWARQLHSICSSTGGSSSPGGYPRPSCTWRGKMVSGPPPVSFLLRQCPSLTCQSAALSWPGLAGHQKRYWYKAKACLGLQGSPEAPGVAACTMRSLEGNGGQETKSQEQGRTKALISIMQGLTPEPWLDRGQAS